MGKILIISALGALGAVVSGCNTSGCVDNQSSIPLAAFYSYETLDAISLNNISVGGVDAPNDSLLIDHGQASEVYLPFRSLHEETAFFIRYEDTGESDDPGDENPDDENQGDEPTEGSDTETPEPENTAPKAIPAVEDTLRFKYERIPYFVSDDCGAMFRYKVVEFTATRNMIDSIALLDSVITNVDRRTIAIYFKTSKPDNPQPEP